MYFNFEDYRPDTPTLPRSLTRLEVVLLTIVFYLSVVILILVWPTLPWVRAAELRQQQMVEELRKKQLERQNQQFVFMQPRVDIKALKPPIRSELSDIDRRATTVERAPKPTNTLPFSRGNTSERIEATPPVSKADTTPAPAPEPSPETTDPSKNALKLPDSPTAIETKPPDGQRRGSVGVIADALRNVQKYAQKDGMVNLQGGADQDFAPSIQFDSKGVDFGPWLRRFIAQIRRNWFIPYAAMSMRGHVVVTFYVGKDGRITELKVLRPSSVEAFNHSAYGALVASNPTTPLPTEYPDDRAFFTVTFFFNEDPGTR
jgi:TonB family protein